MKIVITGALGHIGSALIRNSEIVAHAEDVVMIDDLSTQRYVSLRNLPQGPRYRFLEGDVCARLTKNLLLGADALIHLAGTVDPAKSLNDPDSVINNNLRLTKHSVEVCRGSGVPLIFSSSTSVYTPSSTIVDESSQEIAPSSPYAKCKLREEEVIFEGLGTGQSVVFRFGTIFGVSPGMRFQTAVSKFCWQVATGTPLEVWATAMEQVRPYLAVEDAASVLARAAIKRVQPDSVINAVSCNATVRDIIEAIEACGRSPTIKYISSAAMNELSFAASTEVATQLGFSFRGELRTGVQETLASLGRLY